MKIYLAAVIVDPSYAENNTNEWLKGFFLNREEAEVAAEKLYKDMAKNLSERFQISLWEAKEALATHIEEYEIGKDEFFVPVAGH